MACGEYPDTLLSKATQQDDAADTRHLRKHPFELTDGAKGHQQQEGGKIMRYLVVGSGGPGFGSPEEAVEVLDSVVLPSFDELVQLEKKKKIVAGGLPVGDRAFVFIVEAKSNDELDNLLRKIPMWGSLDWEVTPLQTFAARAKQERQSVREYKKAERKK